MTFEFMHLTVKQCIKTRIKDAPDHRCEVVGCRTSAKYLWPLCSPDGKLVEILLCKDHFGEVDLWG